jgi:hypothetical protein
VSDR